MSQRFGPKGLLFCAVTIVVLWSGWWVLGPGRQARLDAALISACRTGSASRVKMLLRLGANSNARSAKGRSALLVASEAPIVPGPYVMRSVNGFGVCRQESLPRGYDEIVSTLLRYGADPTQRDAKGVTPLKAASELRAYEAMDALRKALAS
jgi:ankyrin repeat protein